MVVDFEAGGSTSEALSTSMAFASMVTKTVTANMLVIQKPASLTSLGLRNSFSPSNIVCGEE
jgi:hypothetical protein